jgi:hypothetical protein
MSIHIKVLRAMSNPTEQMNNAKSIITNNRSDSEQSGAHNESLRVKDYSQECVDIPHILLQVSKYVSALAMCSINIS